MKISLIIPVYNEEKYIGKCLQSIEKYGQDLFEIIVVDNASTDRTSKIVKSFSNVKLVYEPSKGLPFARNKGLLESKGDIVAFIDGDNKIYKGWTEKIIEEFSKNKKTIAFSGPYKYDVSIFHRFLVWVYWIFLIWPVYFLIGYMAVLGNFVARRDELMKIGGFSEEIQFYGDDTHVARKLHKIGKVKFSQTFYLFSSARRLRSEGILTMAYKYIINFLWIIFKNKPKILGYKAIR